MLHKRFVSAALAVVMMAGLCGCANTDAPLENGGASSYIGDTSITSNRYTHVADSDSPSKLEDMTLDGYKLVAENDNLQLYIRENSASIRVVNRKSGYIWGALRQDKPVDLNKSWSAFANSIVSIRYYDETGNITQSGAGHADNSCSFEYTDNGVICHVTFTNAQISLSAKVELEQDHIRFSLDDSSIREEGEYMLGRVYFAPFLGATVGDEIGGYMFVPDGSGALIRFQKPIKYLAGYADRIYGSDLAIDNLFTVGALNAERDNDFLKDSETITMPVYGISHGYDSNALFGYVESGAEYGTIFAEPAGIITDYNYAGAYFVYRQVYQQPTGRDGAGIQMVQKEKNEINPALSVYFLNDEDANYNGMAKVYRNILLENGMLYDGALEDPTFMLDYLVADIKQGFLSNTTQKLTQAQDILQAAQFLKEQSIENVQFNLLGWQKGGLNGYNKMKVYQKTELGTLSDVTDLKSSIAEYGYQLGLYLAPLSAKETQFSAKKNIGITLSQSTIKVSRDNNSLFLADTYYLKTVDALNVMKEQLETLEKSGLDRVIIDEIGGNLYGEYLRDEEMTRTQVMEYITEYIGQLAGEKGVTLFSPNAYLLGSTSSYRDTPMCSSRYTFESDSVPFLQLVLSGNMTMYAPYANLSFYTDMDVLKCIEYNTYPSFVLTGSDSSALRDTASEEYFSTSFEDWKQTAVSVYQRIDSVLSSVQGQQMLSHTALSEGVIRICYANGAVYVNYNAQDVQVDGLTVPAYGALYSPDARNG